ncbi:hypothetical protein GBF38_001868 [Nibea albiflora]|uniref:Uncharacterized protein n=1 Tax=Nibea albiflora TaxID=240163 RepID=A0ACB7EDC7_NIBAL|nr:hypothetical protein GBF38_001868 [Nibea albiflora]
MREDVGKLLAEKGKTMQDKGSLVKEFWRMEQRARREKDRAEQEQKSGGWRARSKIKNNMEKAEQEKWRAFPGPHSKLSLVQNDDQNLTVKAYFHELQGLVSVFAKQVKDRQNAGRDTTPPEAEWVLLRVLKRKLSEPRWKGPLQVTERTTHAVCLKGKGDTWFHWSQCAAAEEPQRSLTDIQKDLQEKSTESADSEKDPAKNGAE